MRNAKLCFVAAFVAAGVGFYALIANASIAGIVTVPAKACQVSGSYVYCQFISMEPSYFGYNVSGCYADYSSSSGTFSAAACDQSWSAGTVHCNAWTNSTQTGLNDLYFAGFSAIPGATGQPWDYYYTEMTDTAVVTIMGAGFN